MHISEWNANLILKSMWKLFNCSPVPLGKKPSSWYGSQGFLWFGLCLLHFLLTPVLQMVSMLLPCRTLAVHWQAISPIPLPLDLCTCFLLLPSQQAGSLSVGTLPVLRMLLFLPPQELVFFSVPISLTLLTSLYLPSNTPTTVQIYFSNSNNNNSNNPSLT